MTVLSRLSMDLNYCKDVGPHESLVGSARDFKCLSPVVFLA